jgi:two-component system LytT family response regulator
MKVVVADDELVARKRITRLLEAMPGVTVVASVASGEEALAATTEHRPDVLVLDISMAGISGLEARALLPAGGPAVIFVTAHAEHAVEAFELGVVDYVLKPVTAARLAKALERVRERRPIDRLPIKTRTGIVLVDPQAVVYAAFDGTLVTIVTAHESLVSTLTLAELAEKLPHLERVDRRHLLDVREIARLEPQDTGGYIAVTKSGARVPVSRQAGRDLCARLGI